MNAESFKNFLTKINRGFIEDQRVKPVELNSNWVTYFVFNWVNERMGLETFNIKLLGLLLKFVPNPRLQHYPLNGKHPEGCETPGWYLEDHLGNFHLIYEDHKLNTSLTLAGVTITWKDGEVFIDYDYTDPE